MSDDQENERGFDDNELADIMSEIETLESDFIDDEEVSEPEAAAPEQEPVAEVEAEEPVAEEVSEPVEPAEVHEIKPQEVVAPSSKAQSSMTFNVEGEMCFKMGFNFSGQSVTVYADGEDGLVIEMEGGVKFQVPVPGKKAA